MKYGQIPVQTSGTGIRHRASALPLSDLCSWLRGANFLTILMVISSFTEVFGQFQELPPAPGYSETRRRVATSDTDAGPPIPDDQSSESDDTAAGEGPFSLEDRIRDLEEKFNSQQSETESLRKKLTDLSSSKDAKPDPKLFKGSWKNQLNFETSDKSFTAHFGGRTQMDGVLMGGDRDAYGKSNGAGDRDAVDFRRARLRMEGTIYKTVDYLFEYDFVNSVNDNGGLVGGLPGQPSSALNVINIPAPTDLYWNFREVPILGNVRVGNQKEPIGLEHINSSRYLDFLERSFNQDAYTGPFNNGFSPGVGAYNNFGDDQRGLWYIGAFKNVVNVFAYGVSDGAYAYDGRLTYLLWDECEGRQLLHVGGSLSHRNMVDDLMRIRSRGSLRNGPAAFDPVFADTGIFKGDTQEMAGAEASMVLGSFQIQSEYIASAVTNARNLTETTKYGTYFTNGYYVMVSYFLTGEHREYDKKIASFGRVTPKFNSKICPQDGSEPKWGAWQILARYSALELNNNNLNGGQIWDFTVGLNWFLNPNIKVQANYIYMDRNSLYSPTAPAAGPIQGFGMRMASDF